MKIFILLSKKISAEKSNTNCARGSLSGCRVRRALSKICVKNFWSEKSIRFFFGVRVDEKEMFDELKLPWYRVALPKVSR